MEMQPLDHGLGRGSTGSTLPVANKHYQAKLRSKLFAPNNMESEMLFPHYLHWCPIVNGRNSYAQSRRVMPLHTPFFMA